MQRRNRATVGELAFVAALAGLLGGAATGAIDGLWSWQRLGQFVGVAGKLRALLYLAATYGLAAMIAAPAVTLVAIAVSRGTRLGDLLGSMASVQRQAPAARLATALVAIPSVALAFGVAFLRIAPALEGRKHFGLIVFVAMIAAIGAALIGLVFAAAIARLIELALEAIPFGPRGRAAIASPSAALAALLVSVIATAAMIGWRASATVSVLKLRPLVVAFVGLALVVSARSAARAICRSAMFRRIGGGGASAALFGVLALIVLASGASDGARKAATAHSGLGGPLTSTMRGVFDLDRDGYSRVLGGGDCDDWNDEVNPGAAEIPEDGVDNNCVGGDVVMKGDIDAIGFTEPPALPADWNVLLLTIDTLRADHLGAYGYGRATSPTLDALAADGTLFENAWAHAPSTRYSIPAILTGRMPLSVDYFPIAGAWPGIAASNTTVAEILRSRGFTTGAILNYWYFEERREMNQGFDSYDNRNRVLHKNIGADGPAKTKGSSSKEQTDKAIEFVTAHEKGRFFLWVHYYDPHFTYEKHPGTTEFGDGKVALYDHEIRYTDDQIGRLIADLKSRGLYDRTVIVATGDHGEGFGEHGVDLHGYHLYAPQTKVPLIIRVPGSASRRVTMPAGHIDIVPTLANLAGAPPSLEMEGRSLVGPIMGVGADDDRVVFQELSFENDNEMRGAASHKCHVIFNVSPHRSWETYEIDRDPKETRDLAGSSRCKGTRAALERYYDRAEIPNDAMTALLGAPPAIENPLRVDFAGHAHLLAVALPETVAAGASAPLTFTWTGGKRFAEAWKVFVHLEGPGKAFLQADHEPARPTRWWRAGQTIQYSRPLTVPDNTPAGRYKVYVGLFRGKDRHPVRESGVASDADRAFVGEISITR